MALGRLELVEEKQAPAVSPAEQQAQTSATVQMLRIALAALSQRALIAVASLVDLALIASVFAIWWSIISEPSAQQMETASVYSAFILAVIWFRRNAR